MPISGMPLVLPSLPILQVMTRVHSVRSAMHHEVVEQAVILARLGHAEPALEARGFVGGHDGLGDVQPLVGAARCVPRPGARP